MKSEIHSGYTIISGDAARSRNLIISSHGGMGSTSEEFHTPLPLKFLQSENKTTARQINSIGAMSDREFITEPAGTTVREHILTWYEHDQFADIASAPTNGFDVVTIQHNQSVKLSEVVQLAASLGYQTIYCLFCRVSTVYEYKPTSSSAVMAELQGKLRPK